MSSHIRDITNHPFPMQRKNYLRPAIIALAVLVIPFIGNLTVEGWNWDTFDFVIMFILLYSAGLVYEYLASKTTNTTHRVTIATVVILGTLAVWAELAVGAVEQALVYLFA